MVFILTDLDTYFEEDFKNFIVLKGFNCFINSIIALNNDYLTNGWQTRLWFCFFRVCFDLVEPRYNFQLVNKYFFIHVHQTVYQSYRVLVLTVLEKGFLEILDEIDFSDINVKESFDNSLL